MALLDQWEEDLTDQWRQRALQSSDPNVTQEANEQALTKLEWINEIRNLTFEQLQEALEYDDSDEQIGTGPGGPSGPAEAV
jgi:ERCC4-type nuclease